jgi:hypothetical protein
MEDVRSEMVRAQGDRHVVTLNGVTVEYSPDAYVSDSEAYRLAEKVRALMLAEGLLIRGDFVIRTERPR